ncbi:ureidoglycolate lyase [Devosia sp. YR412]|uniref:ureidoglycolate lyase n=1 Tax=Devosia sp. YR412 TaxID=1881030 RepID=UPI0008AE5047|nr:ureidoglycolate lyase [Devosia sp. YR412]SEQ40435.1 ureidoglycolate lyase [Devosia sp. YR412]
MTHQLRIRQDISDETFAPFGTLITRPAEAGQRQFYSDWLGSASSGLAPVFHVNRIEPVRLPGRLDKLEKHPHAAQAFVPLDVSRYLVTVAPSLASGQPDLSAVAVFELPSTLGVIYGRNVWHGGASVLDRTGSFAVLMWRGAADDDVFLPIPAIEILPSDDFRIDTIASGQGH